MTEGTVREGDHALQTDDLRPASSLAELRKAAEQARQTGNWPVALAAGQEMLTCFPDSPTGYAEAGLALQMLKRMAEADSLLADAANRHPTSALIAVEHARVAHREGKWQEALSRWDQVATRFPDNADGFAGAGVALQLLGQLDEADQLLGAAKARFPSHTGIAIEHARVAHRRADWREALGRWNDVSRQFPNLPEAAAGAAIALEKLEMFDELEHLLANAVQRFPGTASLAIDYARQAHRRYDWPEASRRWNAAQARFPDNSEIARGIGRLSFDMQLAAVDLETSPVAANEGRPRFWRELESSLSEEALMLRFESLGSGCEFGLVQRHYGAEPLGLLRWGAIPPHELARGLRTRFEGLGEPQYVSLFEIQTSQEYFFRDNGFHLEMHTFIPAKGADYDKVFIQQCRRTRYLREKLLEELDESDGCDKIFVYKRHSGSLSDTEMRAIHNALRERGDHTLLCVRPENEGHPNGQVEVAGEGLLVGYIDRLSETSNAPEIRYDSWLALCRNAFRLWKEKRSLP